MDFLTQTFTLINYYKMFKLAFEIIGNDYYKGLKNKLPPIRYMGLDKNNNELVILAHPRDFCRHIKILKSTYNKSFNIVDENIILENIKDDILEIYPAKKELIENPNGFIGLFLNEASINILLNEFSENDEIKLLHYKFLGKDYVKKLYIDRAKRLSEFNKSNKFGEHYFNLPFNYMDELLKENYNVI